MQLPVDFDDLMIEAHSVGLYKRLVKQLNKDFLLANIDLDFAESIKPLDLKKQLHEVTFRLIQEKFADYLNLLYIIDVPEKQVRQLDGSDVVKLSEEVSFLILLREWQKVWYRHQYS